MTPDEARALGTDREAERIARQTPDHLPFGKE